MIIKKNEMIYPLYKTINYYKHYGTRANTRAIDTIV